MPFCPECREEYDGSVATCAECGAALVESLDAGGDAGPSSWTVAVENDQVGQQLVDLLLAEGVDVRLAADRQVVNGRELPGVTMPAEYAQYLSIFFQHSRQFQVSEVDEDGRPVIDFIKARESAEVRNRALMRKKPREIREMGVAVIPDLIEIFESGVSEPRHWAGRRLLDLGGEAFAAVRESLLRAVTAGDREHVFAALRVLGEAEAYGYSPARGLPSAVLEGLHHDDPAVRALTALAIGRFGDKSNVSGLLSLLGDAEPLVIEEVVEALETLTGVKVDIHAGSSEEEIRAARERFREFKDG